MSINENFGNKVINWISKLAIKIFKKKDPDHIRKQVSVAINGFQDTMRSMVKNKNILYYALPLSFFIWFIEILRVYIVFLAFGCSVFILMVLFS